MKLPRKTIIISSGTLIILFLAAFYLFSKEADFIGTPYEDAVHPAPPVNTGSFDAE